LQSRLTRFEFHGVVRANWAERVDFRLLYEAKG
jgi:hypothetical protein